MQSNGQTAEDLLVALTWDELPPRQTRYVMTSDFRNGASPCLETPDTKRSYMQSHHFKLAQPKWPQCIMASCPLTVRYSPTCLLPTLSPACNANTARSKG